MFAGTAEKALKHVSRTTYCMHHTGSGYGRRCRDKVVSAFVPCRVDGWLDNMSSQDREAPGLANECKDSHRGAWKERAVTMHSRY